MSIITKLAGRLYNFSSSVITGKSNNGTDRKDGAPSPYLNGLRSEGKIETPFSSKEGGREWFTFCAAQGQGVRGNAF